jgi:hypothetical protein
VTEAQDLVSRELTSLLLLDDRWRERTVETITPVDPYHFQSRTSLQFVVSGELVDRAIRASDLRTRVGDRPWSRTHPGRLYRHRVLDPRAAKRGDPVDAIIPAFAFEKRVLLKPDLEDASGRRLVILGRYQDSMTAGYYLLSRLEIAILAAAAGRSLSNVALRRLLKSADGALPILCSLAFGMPTHHDDASSSFQVRSGEPGKDQLGILPLRAGSVDAVRRRSEELTNGWNDLGEKAGLKLFREEELDDKYPALSPLLLYEDFRKWQAGGATDATVSPEGFLAAVGSYLSVLEFLLHSSVQHAPHGFIRPVLKALREVDRMTDAWIMCVPMRLGLDEMTLVKITQRIPIAGPRQPVLRRRLLMTYSQEYESRVGDALSTHIEVASPDPSSVRLQGGAVSIDAAPPRTWYVSRVRRESVDAEASLSFSDERLAFYTTIRSRDGSVDARIEVGFRPLTNLAIAYGLVALFTLFAVLASFVDPACLTPWTNTGCSIGLPATAPAAVTSIVILVVGFLAARDRETISARCLRAPRLVMVLSLPVLLFDASRLLVMTR